jgi:hypothetical protein
MFERRGRALGSSKKGQGPFFLGCIYAMTLEKPDRWPSCAEQSKEAITRANQSFGTITVRTIMSKEADWQNKDREPRCMNGISHPTIGSLGLRLILIADCLMDCSCRNCSALVSMEDN